MNPAITSPVPAKDEMGMDYIPVYEGDDKRPPRSPEQEAADFFADQGGAVPGLAPVVLSAEGIRQAGVRVAPAVTESLGTGIRAVGRVVPDEAGVRRVQTKTAGWVERLVVNVTGQMVRKGEPVLELYSPELLAAQEEYLLARAAALRLASSPDQGARRDGEALAEAARRRLLLLDVPARFLEELDREGKARRTVVFPSPVSGFVTGKEILEGSRVEPGMELFTVADLSTVWVEADLYESEASLVRPGDRAAITLAYGPAEVGEASVFQVLPVLNAESRTLTVRLAAPNRGLTLRPGMFATVDLQVGTREATVIPDTAVMDTGARQVVFVEKSDGLFEPRAVRLGPRSAGRVQVLSGVAPGERVVVSANFLLDSESRLQAQIQGAGSGGGSHAGH
jgi:hypothetical protein